MRPSRFIKVGLITLALATLFICAVWLLLMMVLSQPVSPVDTTEQPTTTTSGGVADAPMPQEAEPEAPPVVVPAEGVTIDTSGLTDSQKSMLATFGFEGDTIYFSAAAVTCAYEALGNERFLEIVAGSLPGPIEAAQLYRCTKE